MGDKRQAVRLANGTILLAAYPVRRIGARLGIDATPNKAFYRPCEQPAETAVALEDIMASHDFHTVGHVHALPVAPAIEVGTDLNFAVRPGYGGLDVTGLGQTGPNNPELNLHAALTVSGPGIGVKTGLRPALQTTE